MPITDIKDLRIFPPLAIGRFGSSPDPLENYEVEIVSPTGYRQIKPAKTLIVNDTNGTIDQETSPNPNEKVHFRDAKGQVKPLAPFLEVWAQFQDGGEFEPLTQAHLADVGLSPSDVTWRVHVANLKAYRRTGHVGDKVEAWVQITVDPNQPNELHAARVLSGQCKNFKPDKKIVFGTVRYIRPTDTFPEIRFRFTPAAGRVFGPRKEDPLVVDDVYAGVTSTPAPPHGSWSWPFAGAWDRYWIGAPNSPPLTAPSDIFQGQMVGQVKVSDGYLDDTCDGLVEVSLHVGAETLRAYARIMSGVPDFAPDSYHVRTISDDLEQMALGPEVNPPSTPAGRADVKRDVEDIIRRACETVRLMNTMVQNGDQGVGGVSNNRNNMPGQQNGDFGRVFEPIYDPGGSAEYGNVLDVHQRILNDVLTVPQLAGSFSGLLRMRPYNEIGDLRTSQRQRMPAMMRGSDGLEFALTRRQLSKLRLASPIAEPQGVNALVAPLPKPHSAAELRSVLPRRRHSVSNDGD